ncbi:hypothetical protein BJV82DRAFT_576298 [Fennellomyces sp. T-0311]|nr:hypothetical protein BJV82DRAFT_576298 [Fennellomyces sp. T-0311]
MCRCIDVPMYDVPSDIPNILFSCPVQSYNSSYQMVIESKKKGSYRAAIASLLTREYFASRIFYKMLIRKPGIAQDTAFQNPFVSSSPYYTAIYFHYITQGGGISRYPPITTSIDERYTVPNVLQGFHILHKKHSDRMRIGLSYFRYHKAAEDQEGQSHSYQWRYRKLGHFCRIAVSSCTKFHADSYVD